MPSPPRTRIVGVGHPDRGDDAAGGMVAAALQARRPDLDVCACPDALALLELTTDVDIVVIIDAICSDEPPGTVIRAVDPDVCEMPRTSQSTHGLGVGEAVALARATHSSAPVMHVVGIVGARFDLGAPPSADVCAAVDLAADQVLGLLSQARPDSAPRPQRGSPPVVH